MKALLEWIEKEGFVLNTSKFKEPRWYSPKRFYGKPSIYYLHEELIKLLQDCH